MLHELTLGSARVTFLAMCCTFVSCGGPRGPSQAPSSAQGEPAAPPRTQSEAPDDEPQPRATIESPRKLKEHLEAVGSMGAIITVKSSCTLLAFEHLELSDPRELFYTRTYVHPEFSHGPGPLCEIDVFSPTESPRLEWQLAMTTGPGGELRTERHRPQEFHPASEADLAPINAVLAAAEAVPTPGLIVPTTIRTPSGFIVYLMSYSDQPDKVAMGPHYRAAVSQDGAVVEQPELLSNGQDLSLLTPSGKPVDAIEVPFDRPLPNEAHVFMSALSRKTFIVSTELGSFLVQKKDIRLLEPVDSSRLR